MIFMLLYAAPDMVSYVYPTFFNATTITITWDPLPCLSHNSAGIVDYNVYVLNVSIEDESIIEVLINGTSGGSNNYTASGLLPETDYGFQVFGVTSENIQGVGSQICRIPTRRECISM